MKSERNGFWKISVFAILFAVLAFISIGCASADTIYVPEGGNQTIQQAVDNASEGDTIIVSDGTYNENVDVDKAYLTIRSENGSANCIVNASVNTTHVFEVKQDYVNISGFTVTNATGSNQAGIQLSNVDHCNISSNTASNNNYGIGLSSSSNNNVSCNWVQNNTNAGFYLLGIYLTGGSTGNTIEKNNIIANGALQGDGSYRWQLANNQPNEVSTAGNWWGTADTTRINASIHDWTYDVGWGNVTTSPNHDWTGWTYDAGWGNVTTSPRLDGPSPCAPTPEPYAFTTADAVIALEIAVGSRPPNSRYDVSGDGRVTSLDALIILQMAAGGKR